MTSSNQTCWLFVPRSSDGYSPSPGMDCRRVPRCPSQHQDPSVELPDAETNHDLSDSTLHIHLHAPALFGTRSTSQLPFTTQPRNKSVAFDAVWTLYLTRIVSHLETATLADPTDPSLILSTWLQLRHVSRGLRRLVDLQYAPHIIPFLDVQLYWSSTNNNLEVSTPVGSLQPGLQPWELQELDHDVNCNSNIWIHSQQQQQPVVFYSFPSWESYHIHQHGKALPPEAYSTKAAVTFRSPRIKLFEPVGIDVGGKLKTNTPSSPRESGCLPNDTIVIDIPNRRAVVRWQDIFTSLIGAHHRSQRLHRIMPRIAEMPPSCELLEGEEDDLSTHRTYLIYPPTSTTALQSSSPHSLIPRQVDEDELILSLLQGQCNKRYRAAMVAERQTTEEKYDPERPEQNARDYEDPPDWAGFRPESLEKTSATCMPQ